MTAALLIDDRVIIVTPSLIRALDGKAVDAIVVQQIHFWLSRSDNRHDDQTWVYNTYAAWARETGFTPDQVRRALERLIERGLVISCQPAGSDRTRWYRIDYAHPIVDPSGDLATIEQADLPDPQQAALPDDSLATEMPREDSREHADDVGFEEAWERYPRRNGKRVGKQAAREKWRKLTLDDRRACWTAIGHYRQACDGGVTIAKDMQRFLQAGYWRDWIEPPNPSSDRVRSGRRATVSEPPGGWQDGEF